MGSCIHFLTSYRARHNRPQYHQSTARYFQPQVARPAALWAFTPLIVSSVSLADQPMGRNDWQSAVSIFPPPAVVVPQAPSISVALNASASVDAFS